MPITRTISGCVCILMAFSFASIAAEAQQQWIKDEATADGTAQIYLSRDFGTKLGKFKAMPESMFSKQDHVSGKFLLGTYRFVYSKPVSEFGILADELISMELLDCKNNFFGTIKRIRKLKGKIVSEEARADRDVLMMQIEGENIGRKLCELHAEMDEVKTTTRLPIR